MVPRWFREGVLALARAGERLAIFIVVIARCFCCLRWRMALLLGRQAATWRIVWAGRTLARPNIFGVFLGTSASNDASGRFLDWGMLVDFSVCLACGVAKCVALPI